MMHIVLAIDLNDLQSRISGERVSSILWCLGIIVATQLLKKPLAKGIARFSSKIATRFTDKKHGDEFCNLVNRPLESLIQTILYYIALSQLGVLLSKFAIHRYKSKSDELAIRFGDIIDHFFLFFSILFAVMVLSRVIDFIYHVQQEKAQQEHNKERQQLLPLLKEVAKLLLWSMGLFWVLGSVFHVNIPALITGLGIGGVAIALAAKESVENLFAAFTILTDKPFQTGDSIKLGTLEGVVERIGFRSTRLRSSDGSGFIIPNQKLVNENLENLSQRNSRRVKLVINIKYGVSHTDLQKLIDELRYQMQSTLYVKDPIEMLLDSFGENVFQLLLSYHIEEPLPGGIRLIDIKQGVNMRVYTILSKYAPNYIVAEPAKIEEEPDEEEERKTGRPLL